MTSGDTLPKAAPLLIVGTGAMACAFAARLSASSRISMLGTWPEGLAALKRYGVRVARGTDHETHSIEVLGPDQQVKPFKNALVLVKSWQTESVAERLAGLLANEGLALTLQNGLGNREVLASRLGQARAAAGSTTTAARLLEPGLVQIAAVGTVSLERHARIQALAALLREGGFEIEIEEDIEQLLWRKLVVNAGINPLTALLNVPNGYLAQNTPANRLMRAAAREAARVAAAVGIHLEMEDPGGAAEHVARQTAANRSSMLQDVLRGGPTEIEAINGAVVRAAQSVQMEAPVNYSLLELIRARVGRGAAD